MFLTHGEKDNSQIARDDAGQPLYQGMARANFAALLPACLATHPGPKPVVIFGHGLFGNAAEALHNEFLQQIADEQCAIFIGSDFLGLSSHSFATVAFAVNDLNRSFAMVEKPPQAIINFMALVRLVRGPLAQSELFWEGGQSVLDATRLSYYGVSLGGIMGGVLMAYEPLLEVGTLGVPGGNWSLMFERSSAWPPLGAAMGSAYPLPHQTALGVALLGFAADPYDPVTTAAHLLGNPLPGVQKKKIFMYEALGDSRATNHATDMLARTIGLPVLSPSVAVPYGLEMQPGPLTSGLLIIDEHRAPLPPTGNVAPSEDNGTHVHANKLPATQRAVRRFLLDGEIRQECLKDGQPTDCDCQTGVCE